MKSKSAFTATTFQPNQITSADPAQLIVLLYGGALSLIAQAQQWGQKNDLLQAGLAISKAQAIVAELRQSLDLEAGGEIAKNLDRLYAYLHELMVKAMLVNRFEPLTEATKLLTELQGAWADIATLFTDAFKAEAAAMQLRAQRA